MEVEINGSSLELVKGDITAQETGAIVNAANKRLTLGGGVAGAIHKAAGPKLLEECKTIGGCETGQAKITKGYELPSSYVIHTVGPVYSGSEEDPELLASSYRNSLLLAEQNGIRSISFPAISAGAFGYPTDEAADVALSTVKDYLEGGSEIDLVRFVLYSSEALRVHEEALKVLFPEKLLG